MFYILYIFMAGRRAVEGSERRGSGQQEEGCRAGASWGAAQAGCERWTGLGLGLVGTGPDWGAVLGLGGAGTGL